MRNFRRAQTLKFFFQIQPFAVSMQLPRDEYLEPIGKPFRLEKIFSVAGAGRRVFSRRLHLDKISRAWFFYFWLRLFFNSIDRPADRPASILFWTRNGISLRRAAIIFLLENFQRRRDCALARRRFLDRTFHRDGLRLHSSLGKSQNDVVDSNYLDWPRIFSQ